jgi:trimethylamine--corrinoid protein Co-methyltransferase
MLGANAPLTPAAGVILGNAQFLAFLTILQHVRAGVPTLLSVDPMSMTMRTGAFTFNSPEAILCTVGLLQMANFYNIRCTCPGVGATSSKSPDIQAAYENAVKELTESLGGSDITGGLGMLENQSVLCFEQMLIDYEIHCMVKRILRGIEVNDNTLAVDLIKDTDHRGSFMTTDHTLKNMQDTWEPLLYNGGTTSILAKAKEQVLSILDNHPPSGLPQEAKKDLAKIISTTKKARK